MKHESIVPIFYNRGKDNCREYGGPAAAPVTRLVSAADHRYILYKYYIVLIFLLI